MALVVKDRVQEVTTTAGTGTITLGGAVLGFQSFATIGNGNTTYYTINDPITGDWEVGIGTYTSAGPSLSRDTVLSSSSGGTLVSFAAGSKNVFVTYPSERSVYLDSPGSYPVQNTFNALSATTATLTAGTVSTTPSSGTDLANKSYVDTVAAAGIHYHAPVYVESPNTAGNLNAAYNQPGGPGVGVGATLTNAGAKAALTIDGILMTTTKRVLIYNQTNAYENGVYTVTTVGTPDPGGTNWVLTRATDADTYAPSSPNSLGQGDAFFVTNGDTGAGEGYVCTTVGPITFGTTAITFSQFSAAQVYNAGTGLNLSPATTFNISNTGVTAATYGSASQVPVFAVNAQGQITSVTNTSIAIAAGAVSGLATSATTDTTNATNITSGTLPTGRLSGSYTGITGVGTLTAGTWNGSVIGPVYGGTGFGTYAVGDLLYADTTTSLAKLADVAVGNALISGGVGSAPSWGKIGLATHTSGILPVANGGTGVTSSTGTGSVVLSDSPSLVTPILGTPQSGNFSTGTFTWPTFNQNTTGSAGSVANALTINNGGAGAVSGTTFNGSSAVTISYNTVGAPSTTGTNASGTWGISISGNAATASNASLLNSISAVNLSNNMGDTHSTRTSFDAQGAASSVNFGWRFVQGNTNGPGVNSASQYYSQFVGLGSEYAYNTYGMQIAYPRNVSTPYIAIRYEEGGVFAAWQKISAGYADSAGSATSATTAVNLSGGTVITTGTTAPYIQINSTNYPTTYPSSFGMTTGALGDLRLGNNGTNNFVAGTQNVGGFFNFYVNNTTAFPNAINGTLSLTMAASGSVTAWVDLRAPIFYDSNDTGYYIDPASTSNSALRMRGGALFGPNTTWGAYLAVGTNGNTNTAYASVAATNGNLHMDAASGYDMYLNFYAGSNVNFGNGASGGIYAQVASDGSFRSPIYYDYQNTAYYVDPASTSNLAGWTSNMYGRFGLNQWFYNRANNTSDANYYVGSQGWTNTVTWNAAFVQFGSCFMDIWGTSTDHPQGSGYVHAQGLQALHYRDGGSVSYGWQMVGAADASNRWWLRGKWGTTYRSWYEIVTYGNNTGGGAIYPSIVYDSDNTGYYLDPNGDSYVSAVYVNNWFRPQGNTGLYFQSYGYGIWSPDAAGGSYGNVSTYGGGKNGWQGYNLGGQWTLMNQSNGDNIGVHSNVHSWLWYWDGTSTTWSRGYNQFANSVRAPIFYDSGNTAYYVDPAAVSNLNGLEIGGSSFTVGGGTISITSGSPLYFMARAWLNYSGVSQTIRASVNVSSVTYVGVGDYVVNFSTAMPDVNYATTASAGRNGGSGGYLTLVSDRIAQTTSAVQIYVINLPGSLLDANILAVHVFR